MLPVVVVIRRRTVVRYVEHLDTRGTHGGQHPAQVCQRADGIGHRFGQSVELAALAEKVVVRVDQQ
ncbi:hypothetical protein D3C80_1833430 [compost metagenome]